MRFISMFNETPSYFGFLFAYSSSFISRSRGPFETTVRVCAENNSLKLLSSPVGKKNQEKVMDHE